MSIQRLQIIAKRQEFNVKALYEAKAKERNKRQVREDAAQLLEYVAAGLRTGRKPDTDGGQSGFWKDGRVEEMVVSKGGIQM